MLKPALALAAILAFALAAAGSAQAAQTITIAPNNANAENSFPFGQGDGWTPFMGFVYKNVPAFQLKANDTLAFDLSLTNTADDQLDIALAPTTANGNDVPSGGFTQIVSNTQLPANPRGNDTTGDYELQYRAEAPFSFAGGGLIIRISNPGPQLAAETTTPVGVLSNGGESIDTSGFFVERFFRDPDGSYPWTGDTGPSNIAAFRLVIQDVPAAARKKCKKPQEAPAGHRRQEEVQEEAALALRPQR